MVSSVRVGGTLWRNCTEKARPDRLKLDFETREVQYLDPAGQVIGQAKLNADPVMLMMHHSLSYFDSGETKPMFYEEQRASIRLIEAAKAFPPSPG